MTVRGGAECEQRVVTCSQLTNHGGRRAKLAPGRGGSYNVLYDECRNARYVGGVRYLLSATVVREAGVYWAGFESAN